MKQFKLFLLTMLMSMVGANAFAHDIEVKNADGKTIYYTYTNNKTKLAVSYRGSDYLDYSNEYSGVVNIPESVTYDGKTYPVTSIGSSAFSDCTGLTSVTIPNSVTSIGSYAFCRCSGLTSLTIPNSVTSIGGYAFWNCSGLTSVTIPNSVTSIGNKAFWECSALQKVIVKDIAAWCNISFYVDSELVPYSNPLLYSSSNLYSDENTKITNLVIPDGITSIKDYVFYGCRGLTSVSIGNSVTNIGREAFRNCRGLTSVTIPNSVTSIGSAAFRDCKGLTSATIGATSIERSAFYGCSKLTSLIIGNSVTSIGEYAFNDCAGLTSVVIPKSVTSIGNYAFSAKSVTINSNAIASKNYAAINSSFAKIFGSQVTEYILGNDVTAIGNNTFSDCSELTTLTISKNVTKIGKSAFTNCTKLTNLISRATTPPLCGPQALDGVDKWDCTLVVPVGSKSAYQAADQWKDFFFIEESDVTAINRIYDDKAEGRIEGIYDLNGRKLERLQRGMNIVRMSDGTTKKVVIK